MDLFDAVRICFKKYVTFSGRARRAEYWYWSLAIFLCSFLLHFIGESAIFPKTSEVGGNKESTDMLATVVYLIIILPSVACASRRLHDINKSGWWQLIGIIPLIGPGFMIFWGMKKGDIGPNRFGPDPLA
jgi:uncharacterized membrane protein YhaH (DUF805 family)